MSCVVGYIPFKTSQSPFTQINRVSEELADCERLKILRLESNCLSVDEFPARLLADSQVALLALDGNVFEMKQLAELDGYDKVRGTSLS